MYFHQITIDLENEDDEMLLLSRYRVEVTESNKGKYLRLTDASQIYCFLFEAIGEMNLWLSRVVQVLIIRKHFKRSYENRRVKILLP